MDKNEIENGRTVIEDAIKEHTRKRDSEQLKEVETLKNQSKKQKTKKNYNKESQNK